jgi:hypothetical protein
LLLILSASLLLLTAACGTTDDDAKEKTSSEDKASDTEKDDDTTTTEPDGGEDEDGEDGGGGDGSNEDFCAALGELESLFDGLEDDDYQGFIDRIKEAEGALNSYVDGLPDDLKDEGETLVDTMNSLAEELDAIKDDPDAAAKAQAAFEKLDTPELDAASDATTEYEETTCG